MTRATTPDSIAAVGQASHCPSWREITAHDPRNAQTRVRYGYFRIYILLRREGGAGQGSGDAQHRWKASGGWPINHKRVYRLYRNDGLSLRLKRPRRHVSAVNRERPAAATAPNALWSMDFVSDALFDGRRLRALTVVDAYTREALVIELDKGIKGEQVVDAISRITTVRGAPKSIRVDNGRSWPGVTPSAA